MSLIVSKITMLALIMAAGFIAEKTGYAKGIGEASSKLLTRITMPLLVITTLSGQVRNAKTGTTAAAVFVSAVIIVFILMLLGRISAIPFNFDNKKRDVHMCLTAFGNTIFLAYPLIRELWGDTALFYAAFFSIANDLIAWTVGIMVLSRKGGRVNLKRLLNPVTLSYIMGAVMFCAGLKLPGLIHNAATDVGGCTTVLSMLFLGVTLAKVKVKELFKGLSSVTIILIKMLGAPIAVFWLLKAVLPRLPFGIDSIIIVVIAMEVAMPCQTVFAIVANECGSDTDYATTAISITTAASLVTLPFIYSFLR